MGVTKPRLTVLLFTHNREGELKRFLKQLEEQTMKDYEVIILDESEESYGEKYSGGKITTIRCKHHHDWGYTSRENMVRVAKADWLYMPNDDHVFLHPEFFHKMLEGGELASLVLCDFVNKNHGVISCDSKVCRVDIGSFFVRKDVFKEKGFADKTKFGDGKFVESVAKDNNVLMIKECLVKSP